MTDPVNTDALRGLSAWLYAESQSYKSQLAADAADEVDRLREANEEAEAARSAAAAYGDRLRAVIENAPHDKDRCNAWWPEYTRLCTCWKADAL